ncbi:MULTISPECIES: 50S ribosomal protein L25/general stress protein Ctc [Virgibacillus]|uniref:Large ribosomal subunit protein bL25 n=1 Tax=Virgibacillus pantothenticus TaxID=1473 RepID=A0A0L0QR24_VIRPA|nr:MULTISPECIES: 50S ribosomal protein L25/general stress protein Ctc [Virgibacillus]API92316.1 50S ribosomal protein L25/general stress protein Ctc [Virgibacillus sp. 6R]KNE21075.1 50S ribosomal protein L25 [Virgibacillus pantothenticus]MBS7427084.1 50S ribosomal protein L25/general stress protein Ctc [Virgibacillus sp. 19R1-5]MBU8568145.1 50S ribosomal protein L25/general stress protein Ctc [Virgibacillus pantothenticus]MBU8602157.1 50S ribosomal protein L25/general stress protein Ctc [Virgi
MAVKLAAQRREDHTKSATKQIRNSGRVPAVIYGKAKEAKSIAVSSVELIKTVRDEGRNAIISLHIEDEKPVDVMLHDYQIDPIRDELVHADFYIVDMAEEMDVEVNLRLEGEAKGTKDGGVLQQPLYQLQVRAKPADIPEEIVVDVSELEIGDSIAVSDIAIKGNFEILDEAVTTVATVLAPDTLEDVEEAPSENAEPELVDAEKE